MYFLFCLFLQNYVFLLQVSFSKQSQTQMKWKDLPSWDKFIRPRNRKKTMLKTIILLKIFLIAIMSNAKFYGVLAYSFNNAVFV